MHDADDLDARRLGNVKYSVVGNSKTAQVRSQIKSLTSCQRVLNKQFVYRANGARVRVVIDIGYGDATEPGLIDIDLPVLLDQPAPNVRAYSHETVIAEKFQAMVALGL